MSVSFYAHSYSRVACPFLTLSAALPATKTVLVRSRAEPWTGEDTTLATWMNCLPTRTNSATRPAPRYWTQSQSSTMMLMHVRLVQGDAPPRTSPKLIESRRYMIRPSQAIGEAHIRMAVLDMMHTGRHLSTHSTHLC